MAEELDTSWFDLKNYEAFKNMSIEGWIWQLKIRHIFHQNEQAGSEHKLNSSSSEILSDVERIFLKMTNNLKKGFIPGGLKLPDNWEEKVIDELKIYPFSTSSVGSLLSYEVWEIAKNEKFNYVWDACEHKNSHLMSDNQDDEFSKYLFEIANTPFDFHAIYNSNSDLDMEAHLVINLCASDEQIKKDFSHWLTNYRKSINYQTKKKLFTQADFDSWVEYGVIPYLDLVLLAKIQSKKITQNKLAHLIFPDDVDVDVVERIRKVTQPKAEWLIRNEIYLNPCPLFLK